MARIQEIVCVVDVPYSFKDEKTGIQKKGVTRKCAFLEYDGDIHGYPLLGLFVSKCTNDFKPPLKTRGYMDYDRFGRASVFRSLGDG